MRIVKNLMCAIVTIACIAAAGCESQQAAPTKKTLPAAEAPGQIKFSIAERDSFTVMGTLTRVTKAEETSEKYAEIWKKFDDYNDVMKGKSIDRRFYGISFGTKEKDVFEYLAGMMVREETSPANSQLVVRKVPAARYAVFQCPGQAVGKTYQYIFNQWLPGSRYKVDTAACCFEQYAQGNG